MPLIRPRVVRSDRPGPGRISVAASDQDSLVKSILNWIPVEVITVYKTIDNLVPDSFHRGLAIAGIVITALWIAFATKPDNQPTAWRQVILASFAFMCWAVGMQPTVLPFLQGSPDQVKVGSAFLAGGTLLLPILDGILKRAGVRQN